MTVSAAPRTAQYTGNGVTTTFAVPFEFFEIEVYTGTDLVSPTNYTITQAAPGLTGSITFNSAAPNGTTITILSSTATTQQTDYVENDPFPAETHERALDRLTMAFLDLKRDLSGTPSGSWLSHAGRLVDISDAGQFKPFEPGTAGYLFVNENGVVSPLVAATNSPTTIAGVSQAVKSLMLQIGDPVWSLAPSPRPGRIRLTEADQVFNKADYPELSSWLGSLSTPYPFGSTAFTFTLPKASGYFPRIAGTSNAIDPDGPRLAGSLQGDQNKSHDHGGLVEAAGRHSHGTSLLNGIRNAGSTGGTYAYTPDFGAAPRTSSEPDHVHRIYSDGGDEARPKNFAMHLDIVASSQAAGAMLAMFGYSYIYDGSSTSAGNPGTGKVRFNNANPALATAMYISRTDQWGVDEGGVLDYIGFNQAIRLTKPGAQSNGITVKLTGATTNNTTYNTVPISVLSSGGSLANGDTLAVEIGSPPGDVTPAAQAAASAAATGATNAVASATAAAASATNAASSATSATSSASAAATSATNAASSATAASTSASGASSSESNASTSATNASNSATAAASSASSASTSASNASTSASNAAASATAAASAAAGLSGTSTSSIALGTGTLSGTTQAGKQFAVGQWIELTKDASNYAVGQLTAYNSSTGAFDLNVAASSQVVGSGTYTAWTLNITGKPGPQGPSGSLAIAGLGHIPSAVSTTKVVVGDQASSDATTYATAAEIVTAGKGVLTKSDVGLGSVPNTDATNASNISSGTLAAALGGAGTVSGLMKANGSGVVSAAVASTDYAPATSGSTILKGNGTGGFSNAVASTDYAPATSGSALLKGNGSGGFSNAAAGTDYVAATSGSAVQKANGSGGLTAAAATDLGAGKHVIYVPASAMSVRTDTSGGGPSSGSVSTTTNKVLFQTVDFDTTTQEFAQFSVRMPKSWDESTVTAAFTWSHATNSAGTPHYVVVWALEAVALSDGDAGDAAFGTAQLVTDTGGTVNTVYVTPVTSAVTIAGLPAAEDWVVFQIKRVPADASDTMEIDARLHGVTLYFNTDAITDA